MKLKLLKIILPLLLLLLLVNCATNDSATKIIDRGNYRIIISRVEKEQLIATRLKLYADMNIEKKRLQELNSEFTEQFKHNLYFSVTVEGTPQQTQVVSENGNIEFSNDFEKYGANLRELLFGLNESIYLLDKKGNKVKPELYNFERNFGLSNANSILLLFSKAKIAESTRRIELIIDEIGPIKHRERVPFTIKL
jgi:hypothetical protein